MNGVRMKDFIFCMNWKNFFKYMIWKSRNISSLIIEMKNTENFRSDRKSINLFANYSMFFHVFGQDISALFRRKNNLVQFCGCSFGDKLKSKNCLPPGMHLKIVCLFSNNIGVFLRGFVVYKKNDQPFNI